jgi:hypothetical protein
MTAGSFSLCAAVLLLAGAAGAHEMTENRARLVLREDNHITGSLFVNYTKLMHQVWAPEKSFQDFAVMYSAMDAASFAAKLADLQHRIENGTEVQAGSEIFHGRDWGFPSAGVSQAMLRKHMMGALTGSTYHEEPVEIDFDVVATVKLTAVRARFPKELGKVLLVTYRPAEVWVESGAQSAGIVF